MMASLLEPLIVEWTGTDDDRRSMSMGRAIRSRGNQAYYLTIKNVPADADPEALARVASNVSGCAKKDEIVRIEFACLPDKAFCEQFIRYAEGFIQPVFTLNLSDTTGLDDVLMSKIAIIRDMRIKTAVNMAVSATVIDDSGFAGKVRQLILNRTSVTLKLDKEGVSEENKTRLAEYIVKNGLEFLSDAFDNLGRETMDEVIFRLSADKGLSNRIFTRALDGVDITPSEMLGSLSYYRQAILQSGLHTVFDIRVQV